MIIGVNHEYETVTYRVVVRLDNETMATIGGITLSHEGKWEQNYTPWGIRLNPTVAMLSTLTLNLLLVSAYRKFSVLKSRVNVSD